MELSSNLFNSECWVKSNIGLICFILSSLEWFSEVLLSFCQIVKPLFCDGDHYQWWNRILVIGNDFGDKSAKL